MLQDKSINRITAWVALIATVFVMLFSSIYLTQHMDHECTGTNCPICEIMMQCENNLNMIGLAIVFICASLFLLLFVPKITYDKLVVIFHDSLISQKIRMNN